MSSRDSPRVRLGDHVDLRTGFPFKSAEFTTDVIGVRLLRGDNVAQGRLRWDGVKWWPADQVDAFGGYGLEAGDVILAMDRPWIEAGLKYAIVAPDDQPCLLVQRVARLRGVNGLRTAYLRYVIGSPDFTDYVLSVQTGTAVPHISGRQIADYRFRLPPLAEQRRTARTLGALDDRIDLNRRMNRTLESIARAIFTSWFVDFDPVRRKMEGGEVGLPPDLAALFPDSLEASILGPVPTGWKVSEIGREVDVIGGSTPRTDTPQYWDGDISFATPKDLAGLLTPVLLRTERSLTREGAATIGSGVLEPGTVLMSSRAPIGYLATSEIPVCVNQGFIAMRCNGSLPNYYVLHWARSNMGAVVGNANGTTFLEISKRNFRPLPVVVPPQPILERFVSVASSLHRRIVAGERGNVTLAAIRDALLPKLLLGQLDAGVTREGANCRSIGVGAIADMADHAE